MLQVTFKFVLCSCLSLESCHFKYFKLCWIAEGKISRQRREASPVRKHPEIIEKRHEIPEWKKKLSVSRRPKSTTIEENPAEESVDQVTGFMKEFEKKKKNRTRGK